MNSNIINDAILKIFLEKENDSKYTNSFKYFYDIYQNDVDKGILYLQIGAGVFLEESQEILSKFNLDNIDWKFLVDFHIDNVDWSYIAKELIKVIEKKDKTYFNSNSYPTVKSLKEEINRLNKKISELEKTIDLVSKKIDNFDPYVIMNNSFKDYLHKKQVDEDEKNRYPRSFFT